MFGHFFYQTVVTCTVVRVTEMPGAQGGVRSAGSMVELLEAEYVLFKSAVYGGLSGLAADRQQLISQFVCLQQRHAQLVAGLLSSHSQLQQVNFFVPLQVVF